MEKKESIFTGINPQPAQKAPVADPDVSILKQKIDALEKRLSDQPKPQPAPPPPPKMPDVTTQALLSRIAELDKRLEEFSRSAVMSSTQMKNIEESKISARREIEDLLKVVREQQKYSELDRQMHDQLEKSWGRVEALEKKLMDFYAGAIQSGREQDNQYAALAEKLGARLDALTARLDREEKLLTEGLSREEKLLTEGLEREEKAISDRLEPLLEIKKELWAELAKNHESEAAAAKEQTAMLSELTASAEKSIRDAVRLQTQTLTALVETTENSIRKAKSEQAAALAAMVEAAQASIHKASAEQITMLKELFDERLSGRMDVIHNALTGELARLRQDSACEADVLKKELQSRMAAMHETLEELRRAGGESRVKTDRLEETLNRTAAQSAELVRSNYEKIMDSLEREDRKFLDELSAKNKQQFEALNTKYADALTNALTLDSVYASADSSGQKLSELDATLTELLKHVDKDQLAALSGVSGMLIRKNFTALEAIVAGLKAEAAAFERIKQEVKARLKDSGGETLKS